MARINFGGVVETVVTKREFTLSRARRVLRNETLAVIGYGIQGSFQALNLRDNGFNVIVGQSPGFKRGLRRARRDGWVPGKTLFDIGEAARRGTVIMLLLPDAAQRDVWPEIRAELGPGKALYFSHGFSIVYRSETGVVPPKNVDVIMVAPKGSGTTARRNFLAGAGINASFSVFHDATGRARERCMALGIGIGCAYMLPTTFEREVISDLTAERGILVGALAVIMEAQYEILRKNGHSPSEAFNDTVEELTQSLIKLVDENGMDGMFANCSATAQRGALDWKPRFKAANLPVFRKLYESVRSGKEARRVMSVCGRPGYRRRLERELKALGDHEMWRSGKVVRSLRPRGRPNNTAG